MNYQLQITLGKRYTGLGLEEIMKKINLIAICIVLVLALVGCASTKAPVKEANETIEAQNTKVLGKNGVPRPDWVKTEIKTPDKIYASASSNFTNQSNAIKAARIQAKAFLSEKVQSLISQFTKYYANEAGVNGNNEAMVSLENAIKDKTDAMLIGIMQEDMWEAEDGTIWVLMSMPVENVERNLEKALEEASKASNTYVENECATKAREYTEKAMAELESN